MGGQEGVSSRSQGCVRGTTTGTPQANASNTVLPDVNNRGRIRECVRG